MTIRLGIVMDPIESINISKDSSFAMLLAAQKRGWELYYMLQNDLYALSGITMSRMRKIRVSDNDKSWFKYEDDVELALHELDVILLRKDPPINMEYMYTTYLLELAEINGTLIVNNPSSIRDANEKFFINYFPECCVPSLVSSDDGKIRDFIGNHEDVILKPLDGMGGESIFRVRSDDPNTNVIIETMTNRNKRTIMAQEFIPQISEGDKRILMINGIPVPYALARIPAEGETRGNLAAGGRAQGMELTDRDRWICDQLGASLRDMGLVFVGIDVIGDYLTEINVTSPTCIRELDALYKLDIAAQLMDSIEQLLEA